MIDIAWKDAQSDFVFFVDNFVRKEKKDRWIFFVRKGWNSDFIWDKLIQLEGTLDNKKCLYVENDYIEKLYNFLEKYKFKHATLFCTKDNPQRILYSEINELEKNYNGWFLSCPDKGIGIFYSGENWIWICEAKKIKKYNSKKVKSENSTG